MIQVSDVSVRMGGRHILNNISFRAPEGSLVAVMGPNGSGKSTLLRCIAGLVAPTAGRIERTDSLARAPVGYVPQVKALDRTFPARSIELVVTALRRSWPAYISDEERLTALKAMRQVGADHLCNESIGTLSGGELQRVYLAGALIRRPTLLLLDEPETGVDLPGARDLHALLDDYRADTGACIVMVTHDWEVAFHHATHVLLLNGDMVSFGSPMEALSEEAVRSAFGHVGHQHGILGRSEA
jgi:zinc transport system ATP-binding protein